MRAGARFGAPVSPLRLARPRRILHFDSPGRSLPLAAERSSAMALHHPLAHPCY